MDVASDCVTRSGCDDSESAPGSLLRNSFGNIEYLRHGNGKSLESEEHVGANGRDVRVECRYGNCPSSSYERCGYSEREQHVHRKESDLCVEFLKRSCDFETPPGSHLRCRYGNCEVRERKQNVERRRTGVCVEDCSKKVCNSETPCSNIRYLNTESLQREQRKRTGVCGEECGKRLCDSETRGTYLSCRYGNDESFNRETKIQRKGTDECIFWDEKCFLGLNSGRVGETHGIKSSASEYIDRSKELSAEGPLPWRKSHLSHCSTNQNVKTSNNRKDIQCNMLASIRRDEYTENREEVEFTSPPSPLSSTRKDFSNEGMSAANFDKGQKGNSSSGRTCPRVLIDVTNKFKLKSPVVKQQVQENDIHRLCQRQKQIEYGKNTSGYERYIELIPLSKRKSKDPHTPDPTQTCSKRSWDGQIRKWRRLLHDYDPPLEEGAEEAEDFSILKTNGKCENHADSALTLKVTSDISTRSDGQKAGSGYSERSLELSIYEDWVEP